MTKATEGLFISGLGGQVFSRQQSGDIFPDHIKFQIHPRARLHRLYAGVLKGVGDDRHVEPVFFNFEDRQAFR